MAVRIGLFGGSFNPIHCGHLIAARSVAEALALERVIFLPSAHPPHKEAGGLLDASHRAAMVRLAVEGETRFAFDDYDLRDTGPTYTLDTVRHFAESLGSETSLSWLIGGDTLVELATWHEISTLVDACRIVTAVRPGWEAPDLTVLRSALTERQIDRLRDDVIQTPRIDVSATDVRSRIAGGRPVRYLLPDAVVAYIEAHDLYRTRGSGAT